MKQLKEEFSEPRRLPRSAYALHQYSRKFVTWITSALQAFQGFAHE
jgi:hypothetical protein